mmetsp:Transcript_79093/g.201311  ORF Transcript_79093/g.201311 Transcript_79093/m.201311 type:complete len:248 (+) Transcript_79093:687-1430(+)
MYWSSNSSGQPATSPALRDASSSGLAVARQASMARKAFAAGRGFMSLAPRKRMRQDSKASPGTSAALTTSTPDNPSSISSAFTAARSLSESCARTSGALIASAGSSTSWQFWFSSSWQSWTVGEDAASPPLEPLPTWAVLQGVEPSKALAAPALSEINPALSDVKSAAWALANSDRASPPRPSKVGPRAWTSATAPTSASSIRISPSTLWAQDVHDIQLIMPIIARTSCTHGILLTQLVMLRSLSLS